MSEEQEGWQVDARPAMFGLALFVVLLVALVGGAGWFYAERYAPQTRPAPHRFPTPELETIDSAPHDVRETAPLAPPPGIGRAMADVAAEGDRVWSGR